MPGVTWSGSAWTCPGKRRSANFSMGHQQMVEIAKALSQNARILIMDEPTSSLTLTETERLIEVVKDLRTRGVSIIYISHRLGEVQELADRVVALRDGRNAGALSRAEIDHDRMVRMMVGRDLADFYVHPEESNGNLASRYVSYGPGDTRIGPSRSRSTRERFSDSRAWWAPDDLKLAQAIFGIDPPLSGDLFLEGKSVRVGVPQDAIEKGIYLIPEDRRNAGLILEDVIRQNITLPSLLRYASAGLINFNAERTAASRIFKELNVRAPSVEERVEIERWQSTEGGAG